MRVKPILNVKGGMDRNQWRVLFFASILLLLTPVAASALTYDGGKSSVSENPETAQNVTFITLQGTETALGAGVFAVNTTSKNIIWSHTSFNKKYLDVDPIGTDRVLISTQLARSIGADQWYRQAVILNWREDRVEKMVPVPPGTHDVDYLGDDKFLIGSPASEGRYYKPSEAWFELNRERGMISEDRESLGHRVYIYNSSTKETVWEYNFSDHHSASAGGDRGGDWTHLNDVDLVQNGSAVLVSPRNFDRVMLINRTTKKTEWTLGEEDNYSILYEQHNPALLSSDPPVVLVADSENNRVVEYIRRNGSWEATWEYHGKLDWPRDADRLPNGNTLIVDSDGNRVIEVTPQKDIVWEKTAKSKPYDVERLRYGDEPQGPPMHTLNQTGTESSETASKGMFGKISGTWIEYFRLAQWIIPPWVGKFGFLSLHAVSLLLFGWVGKEFQWSQRIQKEEFTQRWGEIQQAISNILPVLSALTIVLALIVLGQVGAAGDFTGIYVGTGLLGILIGLQGVRKWGIHNRFAISSRFVFYCRQLIAGAGLVIGVLLLQIGISSAAMTMPYTLLGVLNVVAGLRLLIN